MQKKVLEYINKEGLIQKEDTLVVGVSGGPDSMCLLFLLHKLQKPLHIKSITAAHVNYNLRKESNKEQGTVEKFCKTLNIKLETLSASPEKSDEATLRNVRHSFFEEIVTHQPNSKIATGHTANDNAETLLLNLFRGAGLTGLSGIRQSQNKIKPLLSTTKKEIIQFNKKHNIPFHIDTSNFNNTYTRNILRNTIIPTIQNEINPNILETLNTTSTTITEEVDIINTLAKTKLENATIKKSSGSITLSSTQILKQHSALQSHILRSAINTIADLNNISNKHINQIKNWMQKTENNQSLSLKKELHLTKSRDTITLHVKK